MISSRDNEILTRVGPDTPMGRTIRRYWLPVCTSAQLPEPDSKPLRVALLGEAHRVMGAELDTAKHHQRRKQGGLPKAVNDRIAEHRARRAAGGRYEEVLQERYLLRKS